MDERKVYSGGGVSLAVALTVLFVGLKLAGVIHWSWIWVLAPVWITWAIVLVFIVFSVIVVCAARYIERKKRGW